MARFDNKVVLVSGGARGQGAAEARLLIAQGAKVVIGDTEGGSAEGIKERAASRLERIEARAARAMTRGTGVLAIIGATAPVRRPVRDGLGHYEQLYRDFEGADDKPGRRRPGHCRGAARHGNRPRCRNSGGRPVQHANAIYDTLPGVNRRCGRRRCCGCCRETSNAANRRSAPSAALRNSGHDTTATSGSMARVVGSFPSVPSTTGKSPRCPSHEAGSKAVRSWPGCELSRYGPASDTRHTSP